MSKDVLDERKNTHDNSYEPVFKMFKFMKAKQANKTDGNEGTPILCIGLDFDSIQSFV